MSKWISVKDKRPKQKASIWFWDEEYSLCQGYYDGFFYENNNGDYHDGGYGNDYERENVTHWRPLVYPKPPKESA